MNTSLTPDGATFEARLDLVPTTPGVYLMKDAAGTIIYVGKAVNLRNRLRSYFGPHPVGTAKVLAMISHIRDFQYLICQSEFESLILESNLIKRYQPFYNILLKDDHDYPYIKVSLQELYPRVTKAYRIGPDQKDGARYYGPYLNGDVNRAIRVLHDLFPMKTCRRVFPRDIGKERPCLNYYIHRCIGPCLGTVSAAAYREVMEQVCDFLEGRYSSLLADLQQDMQQAADALAFEKAAVLRDRLAALQKLQEGQLAVSGLKYSCDALGLARSHREIAILKLEVRSGKISGTSVYFFGDSDAGDADILTAFVTQYYPQTKRIPPRILLRTDLGEQNLADLNAWLGNLAGHRVTIVRPERGVKHQVLAMAETNATEALRRRSLLQTGSAETTDTALRLLRQLLQLPDTCPPLQRIEAYDVSNSGTQDKACSMVVFENGRPRRSEYRQFKIRQVEGVDDYASMREAVSRRLDHLGDAHFGPAPDLILLDGGPQHVAVIGQLLAQRGVRIPVAGMVKDNRHRTRGLALPGGRVAELAAAVQAESGQTESSALLPLTQERETLHSLLRFLTALQDEAHRFAGRYNKKLGNKRQLKYSLESIPGIGPARRKTLLAAFGSIKAVSQATPAQLREQTKGRLSPVAAEAVYRHFHPELPPATPESER
ncbi:MAG: excinuclease ABC subunit UvrC [Oscillospiraceae bacterium]|nr:excinuclease ABC subunit UvrC [Oscillospiraceae bacterium]MDD4368317.1 excinuclease ABC subunit UvrC [Oscillospiraceae bacterium]